MNLRHLSLILLFTLATCVQAAADCKSESEIPSTTPASRFVNHGDGTVTDTATGLMWAQCPEGTSGSACGVGYGIFLTWAEALTRARDSTRAGYSDWRLPTVKELSSIIEERCEFPAINLAVFPRSAGEFWSASPNSDPYLGAWIVTFEDLGGAFSVGWYYSGDYYALVQLVRSGQ